MRATVLDPGDLRAAADVFDAVLGVGYVPAQDLRQQARAEDAIVLGAWDGPVLVGVATAHAARGGAAPTHDWKPPSWPVGWLDQLAVLPSHRRRGIGAALIDARVSHLRARGCTTFAAMSWRHHGATSEGPLRRAGFEVEAVLDGYWTQDSIDGGYDCPQDGHPCRCTAVLLTRSVRDVPEGHATL